MVQHVSPVKCIYNVYIKATNVTVTLELAKVTATFKPFEKVVNFDENDLICCCHLGNLQSDSMFHVAEF